MDIEQYLKGREERVETESKKIRDFLVFDTFNYIPEKPLMREEVGPLIDAILRYKKTFIPNNICILGSSGCGKTSILKFLQKLFEKEYDLSFKYVNVRSYNTSFKILAYLLDMQARGLSLSELENSFEQKFKDKTVLVLDEIDMLSPKDPRKEILYFSNRSKSNVMLILLSNNPRFLREVDETCRSSLQMEVTYFKPYNAIQIFEILKQRAEKGMVDYDEGMLRQIAAITAQQTNSDVRMAIKTLFYCATETDLKVEDAFERARRDIIRELIQGLNDRMILILQAIQEEKEGYARSVYQRYRKISLDKGEDPFSYTHFCTALSYLQASGLILISQVKVNRTYTNRITHLFEPEMLNVVLQLRFA